MNDRKNMAMIIVVGIIIVLFLFVNTTAFATTGIVTTSDLRLREEENSSSEILDLLDENDKVEILSENGDWYKVKANGKIGYVSKQYIKVKEEKQPDNNTTNNSENQVNQEPANTTVENKEQSTNQSQTQGQPETVKFTSDTELKVVPLISGAVMNTTKSDEQYNVVSTAGLWSYVKCANKSGWVLTEKITQSVSEPQDVQPAQEENNQPVVQENTPEQSNNNEGDKKVETSTEEKYSSAKTYYVKGSSVNARSRADKDSKVVDVLDTNDKVKVTGEDGNWYVVDIDGSKAYISKSLLSKEKVTTVTSRSSNSLQESKQTATVSSVPSSQVSDSKVSDTQESSSSSSSGEAVVAYAKKFLGYRYVYGTNGPNTFDCSGFVQYVYKHFGYSLSRSSSTQANDGVAVSKSNLQPGDVLIFRDTSNSKIGHVGLYIGDGQFIHASNSKTGVIISSLSSASYQKRYVGARRIL